MPSRSEEGEGVEAVIGDVRGVAGFCELFGQDSLVY